MGLKYQGQADKMNAQEEENCLPEEDNTGQPTIKLRSARFGRKWKILDTIVTYGVYMGSVSRNLGNH